MVCTEFLISSYMSRLSCEYFVEFMLGVPSVNRIWLQNGKWNLLREFWVRFFYFFFKADSDLQKLLCSWFFEKKKNCVAMHDFRSQIWSSTSLIQYCPISLFALKFKKLHTLKYHCIIRSTFLSSLSCRF